jgi:hypothetical protein
MTYTVQRLPTPAAVVKKQLTTLQAVGQVNYTAGVQTPKKDPIASGVAAEPKWANAMQTAIASGIRAKNLALINPTDWSNAAVTIGAPALVPGVMARQAKVNTFWNAWMPILGNILTTIDGMDTSTAAARNAKANAMADALRAARGTW